MRVDGRAIANGLLTRLSSTVSALITQGITPTLAVVLVGDDPASLSYIAQKQKTAREIGAAVQLVTLSSETPSALLTETIRGLNAHRSVHGIIVQRPLPSQCPADRNILLTIARQKDVDGFVRGSPYEVPVAGAVLTILQHIHEMTWDAKPFERWLTKQNICIIGRGETAGGPIAVSLRNKGCATSIIHSQTPHPESLMKNAEIIISCAGREGVVARSSVKPGVILISVGLWRDTDGQLRGDYDEEDIADIAAYYTPTPGGVGPVNVAYLMKNLVTAASSQLTQA